MSGTYLASTNPLIIGGGDSDSPSGQVSEDSDDVRIYNRALTASEISELYASTVPVLESTSTSPVVYYYYPQTPLVVALNQVYTSLGQSITAGVAGTVWADTGRPVSYEAIP